MKLTVVRPGNGETIRLGGLGIVYKIKGEATGGLVSVVEHPIEPGVLVPPHMHSKEDELSYVLEGEIGVRVGEQEFQAVQGTYIFKPRGIPHAFWNASGKPARIMEIITPAGFEGYFKDMDNLLQQGTPPDIAKIAQIRTRYGQTEDGMDWVPELSEKYGVKLSRR